MNASISTMKEPDGNILYPKTKTEAVYDNSNNRLDQTLASIQGDLGSKSSASAVAGNDAFSKISTLNSDLTPETLTFDSYISFDSAKASKTGTNYIIKEGNKVFAQINFNTKSGISGTQIIGTTTLKPKGDIYTVAINWANNSVVPIAVLASGNIKIYNASASTEYSLYVPYVI